MLTFAATSVPPLSLVRLFAATAPSPERGKPIRVVPETVFLAEPDSRSKLSVPALVRLKKTLQNTDACEV